ncbi:MAG: 50S ribosomal protein L29 [Cyanobacteria bacterium]|nr:50S ribosomal protein L29 [Cyanobacteriota bacterium]
MKLTEIRELSPQELNQQVEQLRKDLFTARMKHSMQQLDNTAQLRMMKHQIAQIQTVLKEKTAVQTVAGGQKK